MASYRDNFNKIKNEYETKKRNAIADAEARTAVIHAKYPDIQEIDRELRSTGLKIMTEAMKGKEGLEQRIQSLEEQNSLLQKLRNETLKKHGLPTDCTDPKYDCPDCTDTGYIGINMCHCFKAALAKCAFETSGLGALLKEQSFDSFDLSFFLDSKENYEKMKLNFEKCKEYASSFDKNSPSLIFIGATGLGKTHLSTSVARCVIEKGYSVIYESAPKVFKDFNNEQFKDESGLTEKYFDCDLLILDDLGTEMHTSFTVSALYNLINSRINDGKTTIINTNLTIEELRKTYNDRITSRIFGCFEPLVFSGKDIRLQKLQRN